MVHLEQDPKPESVFVGKIFLEISGSGLNGDLVLIWEPSVVLLWSVWLETGMRQ